MPAPTPQEPGASIVVPGVPNLRDVGGWATPHGPVARGLAYRSVAPVGLSERGRAALEALGVRTVFDLRTTRERQERPDDVPEGAAYVVADVLAGSQQSAPARMQDLLADPRLAQRFLGDGQAAAQFVTAYRDIVNLPSSLAAYHELFTALGRPEQGPVLFHCTTGKDRTGWAAAVLLLLLGVSEADVRQDYLLTNEQLLPALQTVFDRFEAAGGDPQILLPIFGVTEVYLDTALEAMTQRFGGVEQYVADGLGLGSRRLDALRASFLLGPPPLSA